MTTIALAFENTPFHAHVTPGLPADLLLEVIDELTVGVGVEAEDGVLKHCNRAFATYYRTSTQALIGMDFLDRMEIICPNVVEVNGVAVVGDSPMAAFHEHRTMRHDWPGTIETRLRDGRSYLLERKALVGGGRLVVVSDITAYKRLEAEATIPPPSQHVGSDEPASAALEPVGDCHVDLSSARLFGVEDQEIPLTAMEFSLLRVFIENRGKILSRDRLLELAHDKGWEPFDRSIDLRVSRMRKKIERNPSKPRVIRTVRGLGYILD